MHQITIEYTSFKTSNSNRSRNVRADIYFRFGHTPVVYLTTPSVTIWNLALVDTPEKILLQLVMIFRWPWDICDFTVRQFVLALCVYFGPLFGRISFWLASKYWHEITAKVGSRSERRMKKKSPCNPQVLLTPAWALLNPGLKRLVEDLGNNCVKV